MNKLSLIIAVYTLFGAVAAAQASEPSSQLNFANPYVGVAGTLGRSYVRSGGFNTSAPTFTNRGIDTDEGIGLDLVAGFNKLHLLAPHTWLRGELELNWRDAQDYNTASCAGYSGCGGYFQYHSQVRSYGGFVNAYVDRELQDTFIGPNKNHPVTLFAGAGIGAFDNRAQASDTVVQGSAERVSFAYQLGGGAKVGLSPGMDLLLGARYMNLGQSRISLNRISGGADSGNLKLDHNAVEGRIGVNIALDSLLHR